MTYFSTVIADAPFHFWRLADPGGQLTKDVGSSKVALINSAGLFQAAYTGPSSDGGSCFFDSGANCWNLDTETLTPPYSFECWFWQHYRRAAVHDFLSINTAAGGTVCVMRITAAGLLTMFDVVGNTVHATTVTTQRWHHMVATFSGAAANLYLDGVVQGPRVAVSVAAQSGRFTCGAQDNAGNILNAASVNLAEVAYYTTTLTAGQVAAHFAAADQITSTPQFRGFGSSDNTSGVPTFGTDDSALILASVRKTY